MYSDGKSVTEIARELGRSRQWVHKWIKRSKSKDGNWNKSASKMPNGPYNRTRYEVEADVIRARRELKSAPYMESGAYAIWHKLRDEGGAPPSVATINRILNSEVHVRPELMYTYVEARLLVNQNRLLIIQDEKVVLDFDFLMPSV